jgi:hypothetical protein
MEVNWFISCWLVGWLVVMKPKQQLGVANYFTYVLIDLPDICLLTSVKEFIYEMKHLWILFL